MFLIVLTNYPLKRIKLYIMLFFLFSLIRCIPTHLTDGNFADFINSADKPIFLKLWANWCAHCKALAPTWDELAEMSEFDDVAYIADIECESNRKSCKLFEGESFPRLYWIEPKFATNITYTGTRDIPHFKMFIKKQINFPLIPINESEINNYTQTSNLSSLFLLKINSNDSKSLNNLKEVANNFRSSDIRFVQIDDNSITSPELIAFTGINRSEIFTGDWTEKSITSFILRQSVPFLSEITPYIMKFLMMYNVSTFIRVANISKPVCDSTIDICENVSSLFLVTKTDCFSAPWFCRLVDIDLNTSVDQFVVYNRDMQLFWVYRGEVNKGSVFNWARDVFNNKVKGKGSGKGLFSPLFEMYYSQKSQGNPTFVVFLPPIFVLGLTIYMIRECIAESKMKRD